MFISFLANLGFSRILSGADARWRDSGIAGILVYRCCEFLYYEVVVIINMVKIEKLNGYCEGCIFLEIYYIYICL